MTVGKKRFVENLAKKNIFYNIMLHVKLKHIEGKTTNSLCNANNLLIAPLTSINTHGNDNNYINIY